MRRGERESDQCPTFSQNTRKRQIRQTRSLLTSMLMTSSVRTLSTGPRINGEGVHAMHELHPVGDAGTLKHAIQIGPDCGKRDAKLGGNLLVAFGLHEESHNPFLLRGEFKLTHDSVPGTAVQWAWKRHPSKVMDSVTSFAHGVIQQRRVPSTIENRSPDEASLSRKTKNRTASPTGLATCPGILFQL